MAARANLFVKFLKHAMNEGLEWGSNVDSVRCYLLNDNFGGIVDQNTLEFVDDLVLINNDSGCGYTYQTLDFSGGNGITQVDSVIDVSGAILKFDAPDITFLNLTSSITPTAIDSVRFLVLARWNTTDANSPLIGYVNFGENLDLVAQNLVINWHADGIIKVTFATPLS